MADLSSANSQVESLGRRPADGRINCRRACGRTKICILMRCFFQLFIPKLRWHRHLDVLAILVVAFSLVAWCQSESAAILVTLQGRVKDAQGHALAGVRVEVQARDGAEPMPTLTDFSGNYRIVLLLQGAYVVKAGLTGYESVTLGPFTATKGEIKSVDITLRAQAKESQQPNSLSPPEFFDQPQFTIAGVTDTTTLGGHASPMAPPPGSLAKDIASLRETGSRSSSNAAVEQAACVRADKSPNGFEENHLAGKLLLGDGKPREAIHYLSRASVLQPKDYDNSYELARAYAGAGQYSDARTLIRGMLAERKSSDLHHLLAEVEEKSGNPLEAVKQHQQAAKLDPSEANLFDWGAELLVHGAIEPAIEVFSNGNRRFSQSARMLAGLGLAYYGRGSYENALHYVGAAADLSPADPNLYLLLGKMENADNGQSDETLARLERFSRLQPANAWAIYYYAVALWKRRKNPDDVSSSTQAESLLQKAVRLDPKLAQAHLQLGILYAERKDLPRAISSYQDAVRVDPQLVEAHYRLAQAYRAGGQTSKAQEEMQRFKEISKTKADAMERERRQIRQFVYTLQNRSGGEQPQ